jgi:DNA-binding NarL/FixJ family response regulator
MTTLRTNRVATAAPPRAEGATMRILVVDRSRLLADVLARRLLAEDDVAGVAVASSGAEALRVLAEGSYDTIVATPDLALEIRAVPTSRIREPSRLLPIVILADSGDTARAREVFGVHGIAGWVSRDRSTDDLLKAIRICQLGDVCVPMHILDLLADNHTNEGSEQSERDRVFALLTAREVEVMVLLEQGLGRDEIAAELHLSPNTVRTHIQRILRRLDVHSTLAALALVRV